MATPKSTKQTSKPRAKLPRFSLDDAIAHCDERPNSIATRPFGPTPLVYKVGGKIFALLGHRGEHESVSLKCDPERAPMLRSSYPAIIPGYHLNKRHWNTLVLDGSLPPSLITQLIDHSYDLVAGSPRKKAAKRLPLTGRS